MFVVSGVHAVRHFRVVADIDVGKNEKKFEKSIKAKRAKTCDFTAGWVWRGPKYCIHCEQWRRKGLRGSGRIQFRFLAFQLRTRLDPSKLKKMFARFAHLKGAETYESLRHFCFPSGLCLGLKLRYCFDVLVL